MAYGIKLLVEGERACFTRPEMKVERVSYDVMTPSAARGILEAIHWKPAIRWIVKRHSCAEADKYSSRSDRNEVGDRMFRWAPSAKGDEVRRGSPTLSLVRGGQTASSARPPILVDVAYVIEAHFELTAKAGPEDNEGKHLDTFNRRAAPAASVFSSRVWETVRVSSEFIDLIGNDDTLPVAVQKTPRSRF